jgi:D-alanine-D-alanine ligase
MLRVGITFDVKSEVAPTAGVPDDFQEEFDSPTTIDAIAEVLRGLGHEVVKLGDGRDMLVRLLEHPPDLVFNFAEGEGVSRSREARVPAVLEMLGIPYTGSDPLTMAVTLDKDCAKRLVRSAGIGVPNGCVVEHPEQAMESVKRVGLTFPMIAKPAWEGSSKGIRSKCVLENAEDLPHVVSEICGYQHQPVLVEEFVDGDELTVGVIGNAAPEIIGIMRVLPNSPTRRFIYSLEVKRDYVQQVRYECPPQMPARILRRVEEASLQVYRVLGCRDVARIDFRVRDGIPYFLEVNPLPGLNPESSDLVILAKLAGWTYRQLIERIVAAALKRHQGLCRNRAS